MGGARVVDLDLGESIYTSLPQVVKRGVFSFFLVGWTALMGGLFYGIGTVCRC